MLKRSRFLQDLVWRASPTQLRVRQSLRRIATAVIFTLAFGTRVSQACVGAGCLQIWSTANGSGPLTVEWDPTKKIQTFEAFCTTDNTQCLYSAIDPGFMAPPTDDTPANGYFVLKDGTAVSVVIISADAGLSMTVNGKKLYQPGDTALLGTMPTIHVHPSWQIVVPGGHYGDFIISYRLTTPTADYRQSEPLTLVVTNIPPPQETPSPTPTPTASPTPCAGDCNDDGEVTIDELITGVNLALGTAAGNACPACDSNHDGEVTIDEIVAAVNSALNGCHVTAIATLAEIQRTIFDPTCATPLCHSAASRNGNLDLSPGAAYGELVNVTPDAFAAQNAGLLRVNPGHPENSFLLIKLTGPPRDQGSRMPLTGAPLSNEQIDLVRNWILQGANP